MTPGEWLESGAADDRLTVRANGSGPDFITAANKIQFDVQVQFCRPRRWALAGILPIWRRDRVMPRVDGVPLTDLIDRFEIEAGMQPAGGAYGGLIPTYLGDNQIDDHYRGKTAIATRSKIPLLACECGEWVCWPLLAEIVVADDVVTWDKFEQPYRPQRDYSAFGPFRFDRRQYDDALQDLAEPISSDIAGG
ncbi:hypothetical protein ACFYO1_32775 [Nocardia sp. NPDC006044]|uniref:hypothetical protein n=1 Tax=Nocardia sp. NPDC006044 TaxID=3364306 RepID=UPI003698593C